MKNTYKVGIIGFGLSGRYFFSPFIENHPNFILLSIVSSQHHLVKKEYPQVKVYQLVDEIINDQDIDLIIVASPNVTHFDYTKRALMAGKHVVVEKPFTVNSDDAKELIELSQAKKCVLVPFQNRRWDGDFLTVKKLIEENQLGQVLEFESHFDRYRPLYDRVAWKNEPTPGSGVLYDLGPHLIDQALFLFGKPESIYADIRIQRINGKVDDYFEIQLYYPELKVILKAGVMVREQGPRFIVHGRNGSFIKYGLDPQENNLRNGMKPDDENLGRDSTELFGLLHTEIEGKEIREKVETIAGCYTQYFENVYRALLGENELIVKPQDAEMVILIIEKAYQSSREKSVLLI